MIIPRHDVVMIKRDKIESNYKGSLIIPDAYEGWHKKISPLATVIKVGKGIANIKACMRVIITQFESTVKIGEYELIREKDILAEVKDDK